MDYMKGLQYILAHSIGILPGTSLDIMCGHVVPVDWRKADIQTAVEIVEYENGV